ncbi:hypothetical protein [Sulfitobacter pacificus]|uniref:Lipoyl synthase n=1 Tax=Sulfitobacter pacificus TaxID=1499314 RepID=A0ABQ5VHF4_9RHOB|nr:hypothetical protein [Sulfitobacter pacificus]GLQ26537.1 hypothetical protein GCM10007927_13400 [Sulfitobacter pacificus]
MNTTWLMRMSQWARNPPSAKRVKLVFGIIAVAAVIWGIEWLGYWPEWAKAERIPRKF